MTAERDRRAEYNDAVLVWRHAAYIKSGTREKATAFVADVWAARTMLEWQLGTDKATATAITHWLQSHGRTHGYTEGSLRVMVYRALERIKLLEREEPEVTYRWWSGWRPLDLSEWSNQEG